MVDFQQKALDHFQEQKAKMEQHREEEEKKKRVKDLGNGKVEFTDSLGRTRIVDKADVKDLMVDISINLSINQQCHRLSYKSDFLGLKPLTFRQY